MGGGRLRRLLPVSGGAAAPGGFWPGTTRAGVGDLSEDEGGDGFVCTAAPRHNMSPRRGRSAVCSGGPARTTRLPRGRRESSEGSVGADDDGAGAGLFRAFFRALPEVCLSVGFFFSLGSCRGASFRGASLKGRGPTSPPVPSG